MLISTDVFLATHVNFNHLNEIEGRYELKREVERGSTFTLTDTSDLSILFASVNFTHVRIYATLEINPYAP